MEFQQSTDLHPATIWTFWMSRQSLSTADITQFQPCSWYPHWQQGQLSLAPTELDLPFSSGSPIPNLQRKFSIVPMKNGYHTSIFWVCCPWQLKLQRGTNSGISWKYFSRVFVECFPPHPSVSWSGLQLARPVPGGVHLKGPRGLSIWTNLTWVTLTWSWHKPQQPNDKVHWTWTEHSHVQQCWLSALTLVFLVRAKQRKLPFHLVLVSNVLQNYEISSGEESTLQRGALHDMRSFEQQRHWTSHRI